ncbi:thiamine-phosphate kinase [Bacillus sp. H-16]|uniref:thiamine-phosphate kinase n=1 Tax=Alteribacter salitolerans TaxID=2912333 RepID=UPI0019644838|nr:thiamine-phosphate kinase [Alteribacter salitolerans]MBM7094758.1 thiamine-phosphate kinase [Alteribacter salitolerans]
MKDEFSFIRSIQPDRHHQPTVVAGIGDDAALYDAEEGFHEIAAVDTLVEDMHFTKKTMTPFHIGYKALAVNISDIAAMGGRPVYYLVSVSVPKSGTWSEAELQEMYKGMTVLADEYGVDLIGGDTNATNDKLVVSVTVMGRVEKGVRLLRSNAKPDDVVFVTGPVGSSAAGLHNLLEGDDCPEHYLKAHQMPEPQVSAGRLLAQAGGRIALNDISDGLASEANEIAEASGVTVEIDWSRVPHDLHGETDEDVEKWTLFGGEDFQLIGCTGEQTWERLGETFEKNGQRLTRIGRVVEGKPEVFLLKNGERTVLKKGGYNHFVKGD